MNIKSIKRASTVAFLLFALAAFTTSCNRGVGCPNNFSIDQPVCQDVNIDKP